MKHLPEKLFQMIEGGLDDDKAQLIFDALMYAAEERRCRFVNVYLLTLPL
jgi:hypothetical protein